MRRSGNTEPAARQGANSEVMDGADIHDVLRRVRAIEVSTRRRVQDLLAGRYRSQFKGQGIDFDQVREYTPGDDIRSIDWNVTARSGRPFVKEHIEERQLTMLLLVDVSASEVFGSGERSKRQLAAEIASALAFSAIANEDRVGVILFSDRVERYIPPGKGRRHVLRVIHEILSAQPEGKGTDLTAALDFANRVTKRRCVAFLISDFLLNDDGDGALKSLEETLRLTNIRHDLVAIRVDDPRERELPDVGFLTLEDPETGELVEIDTSRRKVRERFAQLARERGERLAQAFRQARVDALQVSTDDDPVAGLATFFERRVGRA